MVLAMTAEDLERVAEQEQRDASVPDSVVPDEPEEVDWSTQPFDVRVTHRLELILKAAGPWIARASWRAFWMWATKWTIMFVSFVFTHVRLRVDWDTWQDRKATCDVCSQLQRVTRKTWPRKRQVSSRFCRGGQCGCPDTTCSTIDNKIRWHNYSCPLGKFGRGPFVPAEKET